MSEPAADDFIPRALTCFNAKDWQGVIDILSPIRDAQPSITFGGVLASAFKRVGRLEDSRKEYERELEYDPSPVYHLFLAEILVEMGERHAAEEQLAYLAMSTGADIKKILELAEDQKRLGFPDDAVRSLDRAVSLAEDKAPILAKRATAQYELKRWPEAEKDATQALAGSLPPEVRLEILLTRAWCRARLGGDPFPDLDEAERLSPGNAELQLYRGIMLMDKGRLDEAARRFDAAIMAAPNCAEYHAVRADFRLHQLGDKVGALESYRKARELDPSVRDDLERSIAALEANG